MSQRNHTLLNDQPVEGSVPVKVGDRIRLGYTGPTVEILGIEAPRPQTTPPPRPADPPPRDERAEGSGSPVQADPRPRALPRASLAVERFEIGSGGLIGREKGRVQFLLEPPPVSRRHASLTVDGDRVTLRDLGS